MELVFFILVSVLFYSQIACVSLSSKHDNLVSKLSNYRLIRPYRSTVDGEFLTYDLSANSDVSVHRRRRSAEGIDEVDMSSSYHFVVESVEGDDMVLNMDRVTGLFSPDFVIEKFTDDDEIILENPDTNCFFQGHVGNVANTTVAISNCVGLSGVISVGDYEYIIEPVDIDEPSSLTNASSHGTHIIYRTTDHEGHEEAVDLLRPIDLTSDEGHTGNTNDDVVLRGRRAPTRISTDQDHYVQTMIVADKSLQDFHGDSVQLYLATLMNLVNKVYAHHTIGLNINFVIVKIVLLNNRQSSSIFRADADINRILRSANEWAASENRPDGNKAHFDMSIFITKTSFGASGYANVGQVCTQTLSAALVLDREGLKAAFVVAHEAAHLLGVNHDNSDKSCKKDADSSAVMAAYVTSNFHNYYWSTCTRNQIFKKMRNGDLGCLTDLPLTDSSETTYPGLSSTFDEQCRFIYGPQASACQRDTHDLCALLYCVTEPDSNRCTAASRTSRPLEGTQCGKRRWCIQGECQVRRKIEAVDTIYEWHASNWGSCSMTCGGVGVKTRVLTCREVVYDENGRLEEVRDPVEKIYCHPDLKPAKKTECPSRDCPAEWVTGPWSECGVTCGRGTRTRDVTCDIPRTSNLQFRCWGSKPAKSDSCQMEDCPITSGCTPYSGSICKAKFYDRYCRTPGYQDLCCYTCDEQRARVAAWKGNKQNN